MKHSPSWNFIIQDNFFSPQLYNNFISCYERMNKIIVPTADQLQCAYSNYIKTGWIPTFELNRNPETDDLEKTIVELLHQARREKEVSVKNMLQFLKPNIDAREYSQGYHYSLVSSGVDFVYPFHTDSLWKQISIVVYMEPENIGTEISLSYNPDARGFLEMPEGHYETEILTWKPNRALIFCSNKETYHRYISNSRTRRNTIIINYGREYKREDIEYK